MSPKKLARLPAELRSELRDAIVALDGKQIAAD
jgi:hypothetical protein